MGNNEFKGLIYSVVGLASSIITIIFRVFDFDSLITKILYVIAVGCGAYAMKKGNKIIGILILFLTLISVIISFFIVQNELSEISNALM